MVRSAEQRRLLDETDMSLMALRALSNDEHGESQAVLQLAGSHHKLLRMWADT